jgi:hypothetical protein
MKLTAIGLAMALALSTTMALAMGGGGGMSPGTIASPPADPADCGGIVCFLKSPVASTAHNPTRKRFLRERPVRSTHHRHNAVHADRGRPTQP